MPQQSQETILLALPARFQAKWAFDVALSCVMLILFVPIWLLIAPTIVLEDGRPVFFLQERWGLCGRHFRVLKFRMVSLNDIIIQI